MEVQMAVDMVQRQAGVAKFLKLGMNFLPQLVSGVGMEKIAKASTGRTVRKLAFAVYEFRNLVWGQSRMAAKQGQMQADAEGGVRFGQFDGFCEGRFVHHQAGGGQDAFLVCADDCFVNGRRAAEIVGVNDQAAKGDVRYN
jgi:hypothetical protein